MLFLLWVVVVVEVILRTARKVKTRSARSVNSKGKHAVALLLSTGCKKSCRICHATRRL